MCPAEPQSTIELVCNSALVHASMWPAPSCERKVQPSHATALHNHHLVDRFAHTDFTKHVSFMGISLRQTQFDGRMWFWICFWPLDSDTYRHRTPNTIVPQALNRSHDGRNRNMSPDSVLHKTHRFGPRREDTIAVVLDPLHPTTLDSQHIVGSHG
jgi:hypothetical protein